MNDRIVNHLIEHCRAKGYDINDDMLVEIVTEGKVVWEGEYDRHRWYSLVPTVVLVDGMYIKFNLCDVHGEEASVEDCIGSYDLNEFIEVEPFEITATAYRPIT